MHNPRPRFIIAITGASGACYGLRALSLLKERPEVETHLIVTRAGVMTLQHECNVSLAEVRSMADVVHRPGDIGANIASGSFPVDAMIVAPCSIKTLSAIAHSYSDDLVSRAADVCLKEGRPLLLLVRETPLHLGHLRLMTDAASAGAIIAPPVPAFYALPKKVEDIVDHTMRRALARVGLDEIGPPQWTGDLDTPRRVQLRSRDEPEFEAQRLADDMRFVPYDEEIEC